MANCLHIECCEMVQKPKPEIRNTKTTREVTMKFALKASLLTLIAAAALFVSAPAQADSYVDYQIQNGMFQSGGSLTGWFVIDTTNSTVSDGQMTADGQL